MCTYEKLQIRDSFMFGKVMEDPENCEALLEALLLEEIEVIDCPQREKFIQMKKDGKYVQLDLHVKDSRSRIFDAEMQNKSKNPEKQAELPKRSRYYHSMVDCNETSAGTAYLDLSEVYVIFICTFDPFEKGLYKYTFQKTCIEDGEITLDDKATTIFFNATAEYDDIPEKTRNLFRYIMKEEATDEITTRLKESVEEARMREDWGNEYMQTVMHDTEVWNDGKAEGRVEGRAEGREEMRAELQPEIDALKALLLANNIPFPQK